MGRPAAIFLCDISGTAAQPWAEAGYECWCVDIAQRPMHGERIQEIPRPSDLCLKNTDGHEWRAMDWKEAYPASSGRVCVHCDTTRLGWLGHADERPRGRIHFVYGDCRQWRPPEGLDIAFVGAFPPCTHVASSGAKHFEIKGGMLLRDALETFEACHLAAAWSGAPYFVENPKGKLSTISHLGKPDYWFHPWHYTAFCRDDHYTKETGLWTGNGFVMPPQAVDPSLALFKPDDRIHKATPSDDRADFRSATPLGFSRAVFEANRRPSLSQREAA